MNELICYCFSFTYKDIERDLILNKGKSSILDKIAEARQKDATS